MAILDDYLEIEQRLGETLNAFQALRREPDKGREGYGADLARLAGLEHIDTRTLLNLQEANPELRGRAIPQRFKTAKEVAIGQQFDRIASAISAILEQKLPVRLIHEPDATEPDFSWVVEGAIPPHFAIQGFYDQAEAEAWIKEKGLPLVP